MPHEAISVFDMFKIGVGPSSSHTLGPWKAALRVIQGISKNGELDAVVSIETQLHGSLAKTGKGHGTDIAVMMGLCGEDPEQIDVNTIRPKTQAIAFEKRLLCNRTHYIPFDTDAIQFLYKSTLPFHPNGLTFIIRFNTGALREETYYSIGGGFVIKENEEKKTESVDLPFPINTASDILHWCRKTGYRIHELVLENESAWRPEKTTKEGLLRIWHTMRDCIYRGCHTSGELPGGLRVRRRAADLNKKLMQGQNYHDIDSWMDCIRAGVHDFSAILDWVSCFALAVNEENASFGRVVTAPTNGAAGVVPATLMYYVCFCNGNNDEKIIKFLLTASEIGSIFKKRATISAAMGGCQAEIGVSSAMAAAALTESRDGSQRHTLMAAEIAMEHHLGLTCDPVGGLVQIPCIERNSMGTIKAISASQLALQSSPEYARVSLDEVIKAMWNTALDMNNKYKETADGGLAILVPISLSEC